MGVDKLEIRMTADRVQVIDTASRQVIREDFDHGCMRCPACGREVRLDDVNTLIRTALRKLALLQQTLAEVRAIGDA